MAGDKDHQDLRAKLNMLREVLKASEANEAIQHEAVFRIAEKENSKELLKTP